MLRVPVSKAIPGMTLALSLSHPSRPDRVLLRAGFELDEQSIHKLQTLGAGDIWVRFPGLDFIEKHINPEVMKLQGELTRSMANSIETIARSTGTELRYADVEQTMRELLHQLVESPHTGLLMQEVCCDDAMILQHSVNVTMLSLLMGLRLEGYLVRERRRLSPRNATNVVNLGMGAMFHDIGLTRVEPDAVDNWAGTGDDSDPRWRRHVIHGYQMVRERMDPTASAVVLHHHQAWDGTGFPVRRDAQGAPCPMSEGRIHVFARIVAAANLFDRLRHPPGGVGRVARVQALRALLEPEVRSKLDPMAFKALLAVAPPYPPGSLVTLSSGERAVVCGWTPRDPCRPTVQVIGDLRDALRGREPDRVTYDLTQERGLWVVETEGADVSAANFTPDDDDDLDVVSAQRAMGAGADPAHLDAA